MPGALGIMVGVIVALPVMAFVWRAAVDGEVWKGLACLVRT
jgi:hypothetical protein